MREAPSTLDALPPGADRLGGAVEVLGSDEVAERANDCGNAKVCLFVVPMLALFETLPPMTKVATVETAEGETLYFGIFDLRGRLLRVQVLDPEAGV